MSQTKRAEFNVPLASYTGGCVCRRIRYLIRLPADEPDEPLHKLQAEFRLLFLLEYRHSSAVSRVYSRRTQGLHGQHRESTLRPCRLFCGDCQNTLISEQAIQGSVISVKWSTLDNRGLFSGRIAVVEVGLWGAFWVLRRCSLRGR